MIFQFIYFAFLQEVLNKISPNLWGIWIPEPGEFLLVESGILGFGIRNTTQGIQNLTNIWNPEFKFH